jgi:DNA-directed RNA polymerase beta subunit
LISSLGVYAKKMGFIETPYRKVTNGVVDLVIYTNLFALKRKKEC